MRDACRRPWWKDMSLSACTVDSLILANALNATAVLRLSLQVNIEVEGGIFLLED